MANGDVVNAVEAGRGGAWVERAMALDGTARLAGPAELRVLAGEVVVSQSGDPLDHPLSAGASLAFAGRGRVVIWALSPAVVAWRREGAWARAGARARAALDRLVRPGARRNRVRAAAGGA